MYFMNKTEIKEIVKDEINKFIENSLDKELKNLLKNPNSQSRNELIKTIKDSLEAVYKTLWSKRDFWKNDIK